MKYSFFKVPINLKPYFSCIIGLLLLSSCSSDDGGNTPPNPPPGEITDLPGIGEARDISSFDLVAEMGVGWNLGNALDVKSTNKTIWGNPITTKAMIDAVSTLGFKTLRIPVTWGPNQSNSAPYTIESNYLNEVKRIVDYGFANKMHVIINVHHDEDWATPTAAQAPLAKERLGSLWTQVSDHFKEYNDSLIFETLNEPRLVGSPEEWTGGTAAGRGFVNDYHEVALNAIRATGGNNTKRHLMMSTWAASTIPTAMNDLVIPNNDEKVIISLHSYFPWQYAGEATATWGSAQDKLDLQGELDQIRQKWVVEEGRPVILGEWGTIDMNPLQGRIEYAEFYAKQAANRDLLTIVWDDGGMFKLFNRNGLNWEYRDIATAIISASN